MQFAVMRSGFTFGCLFKLFLFGYGLGLLVIGTIVFLFTALGSPGPDLLSTVFAYIIAVPFVLVIQAFVMAFVTMFGLWLFERIGDIEVVSLD